MDNMLIYSRIMDTVFFVLYFCFLSVLFTPRCGLLPHLLLCASACAAGSGLILVWELLPHEYNYLAYCANFLLVGGVFSAFAFRERFLLKLTACFFFVVTWMQLSVIEITAIRLLQLNYAGRLGLMQLFALLLIFLVRRYHMRGQADDEPAAFSLVILASSAFSFVLAVHSNNKLFSDLAYVLIQSIILFAMNCMICVLCIKLRNAVLRWKLVQSIKLHETTETASVKEIDKMYQQLQTYRHEMRNHLQVIDALVREGEISELKTYVKKLSQAENTALVPVNSGNTLVNAVLQQKLGTASAYRIPVTVSAKVPEDLAIDETELCAFLGNLLDNAIEASREAADPRIDVLLKPYKGYLRIDIRNRVDRDILQENPQLLTSKQEPGHGIGLNIIRQIDAKYGGMLEFKVENGFFHAKTMLRIIRHGQPTGA